MEFTAQLARIKIKLAKAANKDVAREVFGADTHQYELHPPIPLDTVREFESRHGIKLPDEYVAFITQLGHGGPGNFGGAGPFYGIYPLGTFGYMQINSASMAAPCRITSGLTKEKWEEMTAFEQTLDPDSIGYDVKYLELFEGLMSIGTQGCNGQMMLSLNGPDSGRVVYIDQDLNPPSVVPESNFLDWYEAWLDRILKRS